jgi:hypothetical protein
VVDCGGEPDIRRMRCDEDRHPLYAGHAHGFSMRFEKYPTRLKDGELADHDDWDCMDDLESAGLLRDIGTNINPRFDLTDLGWKVAGLLRQHRAQGGLLGKFEYHA